MIDVMTMTLQQAADHLGLHYMTVYRYVRHGRLRARKVGGTWQVDESDLEVLLRTTSSDSTPRRSADWSSRLEARLVAGDEAGAWGIVEKAMASGRTPEQIYVEVIGPALSSIGNLWTGGEVGIAEEHMATALAVRIIGRLGPRFARRGRQKGLVIVTTPPGERHAIPSLMVSDLLRQAGFDVLDLGADVPVDALANTIESVDGLTAVCVSSTRPGADAAVRRSIKTARRVAPDVPVFVGGGSITDRDHAVRLRADGWAPSGPGAVELVLGALT